MPWIRWSGLTSAATSFKVRIPRNEISRIEPLNRGAVPGSAGVSPASSSFWLRTGRRDAGAPKRFGEGAEINARPTALSVRRSVVSFVMVVPSHIGEKLRMCCSGGRLVCRRGRASRRPERVMQRNDVLKLFSPMGVCERFLRRAGRPGSTAGRDAHRY